MLTQSSQLSPEHLIQLPIGAASASKARAVAERLIVALTSEQTSTAGVVETARRRCRPSQTIYVVNGRDLSELLAGLTSFVETGECAASGLQLRQGPPTTTFIFSGMGPQWSGMGSQLAKSYDPFGKWLEAIDATMAQFYGESLLSALKVYAHQDGPLPTKLAQPANYLFQVALWNTLLEDGFSPDIVLGHSAGEVAAVHAAGLVSLEMGAQLAVLRGELQAKAEGLGAMAAAAVPRLTAEELCEEIEGLEIAAVNQPASVTFSGTQQAIESVGEVLSSRSVRFQPLKVAVPYHSVFMEPLIPEFTERLQQFWPRTADGGSPTTLVSSVTGRVAEADEIDIDYWVANLRQSVLFSDATDTCLELGTTVFAELAPHPVLGASIAQVARAAGVEVTVVPLSRREEEFQVFREGEAAMSVQGLARAPRAMADLADLERPALQRRQLWSESEIAGARRVGCPTETSAAALGVQAVNGPGQRSFESSLSLARDPWLAGHALIEDGPVVPATYWIELLALVSTAGSQARCELLDFTISAPLFPGETVRIQCEDRYLQTNVYSWNPSTGERWTLHASATKGSAAEASEEGATQQSPEFVGQPYEGALLYSSLEEIGLKYTDHFRCVSSFEIREDTPDVVGIVESPDRFEGGYHSPWILDAGLQLVALASRSRDNSMYLPTKIDRITFNGPVNGPGEFRIRACTEDAGDEELRARLEYWDSSGTLLAQLEGITFSVNRGDRGRRASLVESALYAEVVDTEIETDEALPVPCAFVGLGGPDDLYASAPRFDSVASITLANDLSLDHIAIVTGRSGPLVDRVEQLVNILTETESDRFSASVITVVGDEQERWIAGLCRAASNRLMRTIRVVYYSSQSRSPAIERAMCDSAEQMVFVDAQGSLSTRRVLKVRSSDLIGRSPTQDCHEYSYLPGRLGKLRRRSSSIPPLAVDEALVRTENTAIGWKDVGKSLGNFGPYASRTLTGNHPGLSASGTVVDAGSGSRFAIGDVVFGCFANPMSSHNVVSNDDALVALVPADVSAERAVGDLIPLATTLACLEDLAEIETGSRVFVQSGAGSLGRALLRYAIARGAEVVTSTGSAKKAEGIRGDFPDVAVVLARDTEIPPALFRDGHRDFDCIVATVSGSTRASLGSLLADEGVYIDVGKPQQVGETLPLSMLDRNRSYHRFDLDQALFAESAWTLSLFGRATKMLSRESEAREPSTFPIAQLKDAMAAIAKGESTGSVIIRHLDGPPGWDNQLDLDPSPRLSGDDVYLVTGGYGAVGRLAVRWLVGRGAQHIWAAGRTPPQCDQEFELLADLHGVNINLVSCDFADRSATRALLSSIAAKGRQLGGIVHAAGVIADGVLQNVDRAQIEASFRAKVAGAANLLSEIEGDQPEFVVNLSSVATVIGASLQPTYAAANGQVEAITTAWRARGVLATAVQLGPVAGGGMADSDRVRRYMSSLGLSYVDPRVLPMVFDIAVSSELPVLGVYEIDWKKASRLEPQLHTFSTTKWLVTEASESDDRVSQLLDLPEEQRHMRLQELVHQIVSEVLGTVAPIDEIENHPLENLGMDSLSAVEIQVELGEAVGQEVSLAQLGRAVSIAKVATEVETLLAENAAV